MVQRRIWLFQVKVILTKHMDKLSIKGLERGMKTRPIYQQTYKNRTQERDIVRQTNGMLDRKDIPFYMKRRQNTNNKGIKIRLNRFLLQSLLYALFFYMNTGSREARCYCVSKK